MVSRPLLRLLATLVVAMPAAAHIGGAEGVVPFVDDGVLVGAGTTWGVIGDNGGAFAQTCEEAIGDVPRDFARVAGDGVVQIVAATGLGVMVTTDDGCSWSAAPGTAGRSVAAMTTSPVPARLWAITDDIDTSVAGDNALLRSDDGGATFGAVQALAGLRLTSIVVGDHGDRELLLIAGTDVASRRPVLLLGDDRGVAPAGAPALDGAQLVRVLAVDDDAVWFSTLDGIGRGHLFIAPRAGGDVAPDVLLGEAVEVGAFDGLVKATAGIAGVRFATAAGSVLFSTADAGTAIDPGGWQRSTDGPLECLRRVHGDDGLWGCGRQTSGTWFKRTVDGITWTAALPFASVGERRCPATTPGSEACAYRFEPPGDDGDDGDDNADDDVAPNGDDDGPSCGQAGAPWAAVLLILRRRRRRQR
jgi:MYXO-CTERM domain-containing protein